MPPKTIVDSEPVRASIIAVLMLALLGLSVGAAYLYTARNDGRNVLVEDMVIRLPIGWVKPDAADTRGRDDTTVFHDSVVPDRELTVQSVDLPFKTEPSLFYSSLAYSWFGGRYNLDETASPSTIKRGGLTIYRYVLRPKDARDQFEAYLALATQDKRRYRVLLMTAPTQTPSDHQPAAATNRALFDQICESVSLAR